MKSINIHLYTHFLSLVTSTTMPPKRNHSLGAALPSPNQTQKSKRVKKHQTRMTEWDGILPPPIENQEPTTRPKSLSLDQSVLVSDSEYGQSSAKDEEKVLDEGKSIPAEINISQGAFSELASMEKKDEATAILNFTKFPGYSYSSPTKRPRKGWIWKHGYDIQHIAEIKRDGKAKR